MIFIVYSLCKLIVNDKFVFITVFVSFSIIYLPTYRNSKIKMFKGQNLKSTYISFRYIGAIKTVNRSYQINNL